MSFKNNPFDRFSYFDPESKLSEFRKNFFQNQNKMFADSNRWPNGVDSHLMTKNPKTESNRFEAKEEGIPIKVVHENSEYRPDCESNDDRNQDSMSSFGSSQSQRSNDTSNSSGSGGVFHSNRSQDSSSGEPRVYHIPITVEPREGSTSSGYTSEVIPPIEQPLSRSSSHSSAHSVGSARSQNRSFSPNTSQHSDASKEKKERKIPVKVEVTDNQRTASPPKENTANFKNDGKPQSKPKPKTGPFVTRIPVVSPEVSPPPMKEPTPEPNIASEPKVVSKVDPSERINEVLNDLKKYENEVNQFQGTANDMKYKVLDEMLTRCMIKLDTIETNGIEEVRKARKAAVLAVNQCIALLERKVDKKQTNVTKATTDEHNTQSEEPMETSTPEPTEQQMKAETTDANKIESQNTQNTENTETANNETNGLQTNQNNSQNQSSDNNKTTESQRKETAV